MNGMSSEHLTGAATPAALASFLVRKVSPFMTVEVHGNTWSVEGLPGVLVGDRVHCLPTPGESHVFVQRETVGVAHGVWAVPVVRDDFGFPAGALIIGRALGGAQPSAAGAGLASGQGAAPVPAACGARPQAEVCHCGRALPHASGE